MQGRDETYCTAGTKAPNGTMANPSTRTAADCIKAASNLVPTGMLSIVLNCQKSWCREPCGPYSLPMSSTRNATKSIDLADQLVLVVDFYDSHKGLRQSSKHCKKIPSLPGGKEIQKASVEW